MSKRRVLAVLMLCVVSYWGGSLLPSVGAASSFNFSVSVDPSWVSINGSARTDVTVAWLSGSGNVALSSKNLAVGISVSYAKTTAFVSSNSPEFKTVLTISASYLASIGNGTATVTAKSKRIVRTALLNYTVVQPPTGRFLLLRANLHTHTKFRDGQYTPTEVVDIYKNAGYDVLAITDHNTIGGYEEAKAEGDRVGMTVICGEEISNTWANGHDQHILGLFLNATIPPSYGVTDPKPFFDQIHAQNGVGQVAHHWVYSASSWTTQYDFTKTDWYPFFGQPWIDGWTMSRSEPQSTYDAVLGEGCYITFDHDFHGASDVPYLSQLWTVIIAQNRTEAGIRDALLHQRTVCYYQGFVWGTPEAIAIYNAGG